MAHKFRSMPISGSENSSKPASETISTSGKSVRNPEPKAAPAPSEARTR